MGDREKEQEEKDSLANLSALFRPLAHSPFRPFALWVPVLLWAGMIYYWSDQPFLRITDEWWDIIARKIAHAFVFGVLARLFMRAFQGSTSWSRKKIFAWSLLWTALYACSDEFHQSFVPGRVGALTDVLIDSAGAWLALGLRPRH